MPRVAEPIKNAETLDSRIVETIAERRAAGKSGQFKLTVGGHPPGLMLQITPAGASSWILRSTVNGTRREIGLGAYRRAGAGSKEPPSVSLSQARALGKEYFDKISEGRDPVAERSKARERQRTFKDVAEQFIAENAVGWSNPKHRQQWTSTLATWAYPKIGTVPIATLDNLQVKSVLMQPVAGTTLWAARHETATRVRQRIEKVCAWARAHGHREGANPATWRDNLREMMPRHVGKVQNHPALPYPDAPAFMAKLRARVGKGARALEFAILTAARSGEVRLADWSEINLDAKLWTIPAARMKAGKQHTVPLSDAAAALLQATPEAQRHGLIFPGAKRGGPMSDMTLTAVLRRMGHGDITAHGFRSTFRDWGGEVSSHAESVLENALAHQLDDKVAAAYARGNQLEKRRAAMDDWAVYLSG